MERHLPERAAAAVVSAGFDVIELTGRGGSGTVYKATERESGDLVALKLLDEGVDFDRLSREARALDQVEHKAIPKVRHVHLEPDVAFLVVDWIDGVTLAHLLGTSGSLPPDRALGLFHQLAEGLDAIHAAGVVHGDLSPDNLLVGPNDRLSLIDFGVSRSMTAETVTNFDLAAGTPRYVAPEVLEAGQASPASDQYSAAVMLHEMLTGTWPYPDTGNNVAATLHHHLHSAAIPVSEANHWLPDHLNAPVLHALSKNADERFASVGELAASLRTPPGPPPGQGTSAPKRMLVVAAVLAGLALVGFVVAQLLEGDGNDPSATQGASLVAVDTWESGYAASLECNLLTEIDFETDELLPNYFTGEEDKNDIAPLGGVDQSRALLIGTTADYGLYGQQVEIEPGESYVFSANVSRSGEPGSMVLRVGWLDDSFTPLDEDDEVSFDVEPGMLGQMTIITDPAPTEARYAVAILENGASTGVLIADELVFAIASDPCAERVRG